MTLVEESFRCINPEHSTSPETDIQSACSIESHFREGSAPVVGPFAIIKEEGFDNEILSSCEPRQQGRHHEEDDEERYPLVFCGSIRNAPSRRRSWRLLGSRRPMLALLFVLLLVAALLINTLWIRNISVDSSSSGEGTVLSQERFNLIKNLIQQAIGTDRLSDMDLNMSITGSNRPYVKAFYWMVDVDPMQLSGTEPSFLQRYMAAYLFFATSMEQPWVYCNPPPPNELHNSSSQIVGCEWTYWSSFVPPWDRRRELDKRGVRWLSCLPECNWFGISCDERQQILRIELAGGNMTGPFPEGIQFFPFLRSLNLGYGTLRGPLPVNMMVTRMKHLVELDLSANAFNGTVSSELFWQMRNLGKIILHWNDFSGPLESMLEKPANYNNDTVSVSSNLDNQQTMTPSFTSEGAGKVKVLNMDHNRLNGTLSSVLCHELVHLVDLQLSNNEISGPLPSCLGQLELLDRLDIDDNQLAGPLPSELGRLSQLNSIRLSGNQLDGQLPLSLSQCRRLQVVMLSRNKLTGVLPEELLTAWVDLSVFNISHNPLNGTLPSQWGTSWLSALQLDVSDTQLTGTIPPNFCSHLRATSPVGILQADCLGSQPHMSSSHLPPPEIWCPYNSSEDQNPWCCTRCCNRTGQACVPMNV